MVLPEGVVVDTKSTTVEAETVLQLFLLVKRLCLISIRLAEAVEATGEEMQTREEHTTKVEMVEVMVQKVITERTSAQMLLAVPAVKREAETAAKRPLHL